MQQQQQQQERSWTKQIGSLFRQPERYGPAILRDGGSGQIDGYIFTMDPPVDRNIFLVEYDVDLFTVRVQTRK